MDLSPCLPGAQRIDTHISTVWLLGEHAWKIKKPVALPFLDFSTLERRRFFLGEELRLNRRTAPGLYLELLPVTGSAQAPVIGGDGEAIDWVLKMRRFPDGALLSELAEAGALTREQIDSLAAHLADFHAGLPALPPEAAPEKDVVAWTGESLAEVERNPSRPADIGAGRIAALRAALLARLAAQSDWRAQRIRDGFLREGHGDLHLGNLVLWQGGVIAFDAIEFDPALRVIDTCCDIAFAFMDLVAHGCEALAWRLIDGYCERSGDFGGLAGLRAFAAYRALVRAKVALLSGQPDRFLRYWLCAEQLVAPPPKPALVLTMGLSGSGKSTLAACVAEALGAVRLRSDVERKRLFGLRPTERAAPGIDLYDHQATRRTYDRVGELARQLLASGHSVVVDAAALKQSEREALRDLASLAGADFLLLECVADPVTVERRLLAREQSGLDASDAGVEVMRRQREFAEPVPAGWAEVHRVVRNDGTTRQLEQAAAALLRDWRDRQ